MSIIHWTDEYVTGDAVVDKQHRALFAMVNALHAAIVERRAKEVMGDILNALERYVVQHFDAERRLMETSNYPDMESHVLLHRALEDKARDVIEEYREGRLVLGVTLSQFLGKWLQEHILIQDKKMIDWVKNHRGAADGSGSFRTGTNDVQGESTSRLQFAQAVDGEPSVYATGESDLKTGKG